MYMSDNYHLLVGSLRKSPTQILADFVTATDKHRALVYDIGIKLGGDPCTLALHDISKYSAEELIPSAARWALGRDSIEYQKAWLNHLSANPHHWRYWLYNGGNAEAKHGAAIIPTKYLIEMVADWMAASLRSGSSTPELSSKWLEEEMPTISYHLQSSTLRELNTIVESAGIGSLREWIK